ncbi:hypothetical protein AVEN_92749-1 [Araneus ventricosus]|uniref:Uncharacterized protein n=1 Tax=Araneus ventricosus TaxID=182803 RepID=A0A4Y2KED1_ARAVE|nr:hypothetical protein AVEN_92749-1 [Araneus ventricosus]
MSRISSAIHVTSPLNLAKTNAEGESSDKSGTEKCVSKSKDCVVASPNKAPTVIELTSFGRKCPRHSLHRRKRHYQDKSLSKLNSFVFQSV